MHNDPDIVPDKVPLIFLDSKSDICMEMNVKDIKHTRHISRRIHFVRNGENWKMHNIYWCEGGMKLADIATKSLCETYLTPSMKYIMVRLDNWDRTLV